MKYRHLCPVALLALAAFGAEPEPEPVRWKSLFKQSATFLVIENGFRYATEEATRHPHLPFFKGYVDSITNLHGWTDGNPFLDNYIGHPMQGAVSGFIWLQNDRQFRNVQFGRDPEYWRSRLRAGAYTWVYSTAVEIGPFSEASIGNIQAKWPEQGLVDHVITPAVGMAWLIAEDAIDRFVIRPLVRRTNNRVYHALIRGGLNPTRSFANVIDHRWPWARLADDNPPTPIRRQVTPQPGVPPFELAMNFQALNSRCLGAGATIAFRLHAQWQLVGDWNGCQMNRLPSNRDGDGMTFLAGPRWTPLVRGRLRPHFQLLAGGAKITQDIYRPRNRIQEIDSAGWAISTGAGVDLRINRALTLRLGSIDYLRTWMPGLPGFPAPNGLQLKTGIVLHTGTW